MSSNVWFGKAAQPAQAGGRNYMAERGNFIFKNGLMDVGKSTYEGKIGASVLFRVAGTPAQASDGSWDILPMMITDSTAPPDTSSGRLYWPTCVYSLSVARFIGPPFNPQTNEAAMRIHVIDDHSPAKKAEWLEEGRAFPPTCFDILISRARMIVPQNPYKWSKYFNDKDTYHSPLSPPTVMSYVPGLCMGHPHPKVNVSPESPGVGLLCLSRSGYDSLMKLMHNEVAGYTLPDGVTTEQLGSRAGIIRRFGFDLTDPLTGPVLELVGVPRDNSSGGGTRYENGKLVKVESGGSGKMDSDRYEMRFAHDAQGNAMICPLQVEAQRSLYTSPDELFEFREPKEVLTLLLDHSVDPGWSEFLVTLAEDTSIACSKPASMYSAVHQQAPNQQQYQQAPNQQQYQQQPVPQQMPQQPAPQQMPQQPVPQQMPQQPVPGQVNVNMGNLIGAGVSPGIADAPAPKPSGVDAVPPFQENPAQAAGGIPMPDASQQFVSPVADLEPNTQAMLARIAALQQQPPAQ